MEMGDLTRTRDGATVVNHGTEPAMTMTDVAVADDGDLVGAIVREALYDAAEAAVEPVLVVGGDPECLRILWANRAFADAMCAEVVDLADVPVESVLRGVAGPLPLNDRRAARFRATMTPRLGFVSSWDAACFPSVTAGRRSWLVSLRNAAGPGFAEPLLAGADERFRALSERAPIGIFTSEVGLRWGYVNDWLAGLVGVPAARLLGTSWMDVVADDHLDAVSTCLLDALAGTAGETPARLVAPDGRERWVTIRAVPIHAPDAPAAFLGTVEDVTERRLFEEMLSWQATHDPLTRLPNRTRLQHEIHVALAEGAEHLAVLFLDLDEFKAVNDTLGHSAGDDLLVEVAARLTDVVGGGQVFRFAGDEFVVVVRGMSDRSEVLALGDELCRRIVAPMTLRSAPDVAVSVGCSVGVSFAEPDSTVEQLVHDADVAMYEAKRAGRARR